MPTKDSSNIRSGPIIFFRSRVHYITLNIIVIQALFALTSIPEKAPGNADTLKLKTCKPVFQAAVCYAIGCIFRRRPVSTRFNASGTGGRCSPSPSRAYGTRIRSLRGFWHRP